MSRTTKPLWPGLLISLGSSLVLLWAVFSLAPQLQAGTVYARVGIPVLRIFLFVGLGLVVGEVIEATGWTKYLAVLARPLFSYAHLGPRCSAAFTTAFVSGVAANGMLIGYYRNNQISKRQLFVSNFINHLPAFFLHLPTTLFIILPLAGAAGGVYLLLVLAAVILRTALLAVYGHIRLPAPREPDPGQEQSGTKKSGFAGLTGLILRKIPARLGRIMQYVVPIYLLVFLLKVTGCFDFVQEVMAGTAVSTLIPVESLSMVVISFLADYTSGFATAGALLSSHVLGFHQVVAALILGNVIAAPIRALRHQLPRYLGIFSPGMGTQLLFMGQGLRIASLLLVGTVYMAAVHL